MKEFWKISGKRVSLNRVEESAPVVAPESEIKFIPRPGGITLVEVNGVRRRVYFEESKGNLSTSLSGKLYFGKLEKQEWSSGAAGGSESDLVSQFPGKIRKILVEVGTIVDEGVPLLMMEAMKMEFSIKAPFKGRVEKWNVEVGAQVSPGQKFLEFKAEAASAIEKKGSFR